jgi:hypothetical protein
MAEIKNEAIDEDLVALVELVESDDWEEALHEAGELAAIMQPFAGYAARPAFRA